MPISSAGASVIAFLFSSETGNTDRGFADPMGCENAKHAIQTTLVTAAVEYRVLRPCDPVAAWRCPASRGMSTGHIASPGKDQIQNQSKVSTECVSLSHHRKVEKS